MASIILKDLKKSFASVEVLHGVNLEIQDHEFVVFIGPSGCGKTTLLRLISGLESPTSGRVFIDGVDVTGLPPVKRGVAKVFQSYALYPHMTVYDNIAFGLKMSGWKKHTLIAKRVQEVARILQLEPFLKRYPRELSGGQRQRVAIGRAIARTPKVFLFDEPLSNLDANLRSQMRLELATLKSQLRATMVYVTHDQVEAMTLADRIVVLKDGRIEQVGTPLDVYYAPMNRFVAGFIGSMNFLEGIVDFKTKGIAEFQAKGFALFPFPSILPAGKAMTLGIRPESFQIGESKHDENLNFKGVVSHVEHLGSESNVHLQLTKDTRVIMRVQARVHVGEQLIAHVPFGACRFFNSEGKAIRPALELREVS